MSFLIIQYTNPKFWKAKVTKVEFFILQRILLVGNELSLRIMMMQVWCSVFSFSVTTMYMYYASKSDMIFLNKTGYELYIKMNLYMLTKKIV